MRATLLDTGPVVGLLHQGDAHHDSTIEAMKASVAAGRGLACTWEVVGEAFTLIRLRIAKPGRPTPAFTVLQWAEDGGATVEAAMDFDQRRAAEILRGHADVRLSYVDALVLAISERLGVEELLTVDAHLGAVRLARELIVTVV